MPPKEQTTATSGVSTFDTKLLILYVKCMETKPDVNYDKLATLGGYKGAKSARDNINKMLKRVMPADEGEDGDGADDSSKATPKKRKADSDGGAEDTAGEESPKKSKQTKKAANTIPKKAKKGAKSFSEEAVVASVETDVKEEAEE